MEVGDVFYIKFFIIPLPIRWIRSDSIAIRYRCFTDWKKGKDYVTLVTCTPYAVNTHRLLVRGTRIPYEEAQKIDEEVGLHHTIPFNLILLIGGIVALIIIWVSIKSHKRRKEKKHEQNK